MALIIWSMWLASFVMAAPVSVITQKCDDNSNWLARKIRDLNTQVICESVSDDTCGALLGLSPSSVGGIGVAQTIALTVAVNRSLTTKVYPEICEVESIVGPASTQAAELALSPFLEFVRILSRSGTGGVCRVAPSIVQKVEGAIRMNRTPNNLATIDSDLQRIRQAAADHRLFLQELDRVSARLSLATRVTGLVRFLLEDVVEGSGVPESPVAGLGLAALARYELLNQTSRTLNEPKHRVDWLAFQTKGPALQAQAFAKNEALCQQVQDVWDRERPTRWTGHCEGTRLIPPDAKAASPSRMARVEMQACCEKRHSPERCRVYGIVPSTSN